MKKIFKSLICLSLCASILCSTGVSGVTVNEATDDGEEMFNLENASLETTSGASTLTMSAIYSDNMVLQRGKPINVSGYSSSEGSTVKVTLGDESLEGTVENGEWLVTFAKREAAKGLTLTVELVGTDVSKSFSGVDIGEVFITAGQSNMQYDAYKIEDYAEYLSNADNFDNIKVFYTPGSATIDDEYLGKGTWYDVNSTYLNRGNAANGMIASLGYIMAVRLAAELGDDVTVAVVNAYRNGSGIRSWLSPEWVKEYGTDEQKKQYDLYTQYFDKYGKTPSAQSDFTAEFGAENADYFTSRPYANLVTGNYNSMIAPYENYSIAGVIWYQGCANVGEYAAYKDQFKYLEADYRRVFGNDSTLPFFVVQLSPTSGSRANFNAMLYDFTLENTDYYDENTYVISTAIDGSPYEAPDYVYSDELGSHPSRKSPLGMRIAAAVLDAVYGIGDSGEARIVSITRGAGGVLTVTFDRELAHLWGDTVGTNGSVSGFEILDSAGEWCKGTAKIDPNDNTKVLVYNNGVSSPKGIRYGFGACMLELTDGTRLDFVKNNASNISKEKEEFTYVYTVTENGATVTKKIVIKPGDVLRMIKDGNLSSKDGVPLSVFQWYFD